MFAAIEKLKVRLAVAFIWRRRSNVAEAIRGFQATEVDGVWHLRRGLARLTDPRHRAILFAHGLEEESHADEFASTYGHYADRPLVPSTYERKDLYPDAAPTWKTIAYVHVGETDATERFRILRDALEPSQPLHASLARIVCDEEGHVDLTHRMLVEMGATEREIRSEVRRVRLGRLWERWLRIGKRVADTLATLLLSVTYYVLGPIVARVARRRLSSRFIEYDNNQIKQL